jgi:hypothetical protein
MPELNSIQTFEKIDSCNFRPTLERFCNVVRKADLWNEGIRDALKQFEIEKEGDGYVYTSVTELGHLNSNLSGVKIRALITGYTSAVDRTFAEDWISCEFLIETSELKDFDGKLHDYSYDLIRKLSLEMQSEFRHTGVYFTNQSQDGSDFDGIRCGDSSKLWQFDYALIPLALADIYKNKPYTHGLKQHGNYLEIWDIEHWKEVQPLAAAS